MLKHAILAASLLLNLGALTASAGQGKPAVKLSSSGICHTEKSPFYEKTRRFTEFQSLQACLQHGRLPRQASFNAPDPVTLTSRNRANYDRSAFGQWIDADNDCLNTRHELLSELSTGPIRMSASGCSVLHGRWNDPYTGQIFTRARDLDIDHLVPLAYAWSRGADRWSFEQRLQFANDPINLYAVDAATNRDKGPRGPAEWIPPNRAFQCQYVLRFQRVSNRYGLLISASERAAIRSLRNQVCSK